ncbi:MAG: hypothetical protein ACTSV6_07440 [Candidatus Heimdallarchaeota archaeon]
MIEELYEISAQKKKRGSLGKLFVTGGKLIGGGMGCVAGSVAGAVYVGSKEILSLMTTQQIYPLHSAAVEYLSIVGILSLTGTLAGYYLSGKILDIF